MFFKKKKDMELLDELKTIPLVEKYVLVSPLV